MYSNGGNSVSPNRLVHEKSPYLLQHAYNPVEWFPWGDAAFEKARLEDKPVLLSIGYSTCHWCHVMERETFSDPSVGEIMNRWLVSVKVDREELPDVDSLYMNAVTAMTGSGGWPLNVFLTPEGKPFYGGTYFPAERQGGMPGWKKLVEHIGQLWGNPEERHKLIDSADILVKSLRDELSLPPEPGAIDPELVDRGFERIRDAYDPRHGGFGHAPKFPLPSALRFLMDYAVSGQKGASREKWTGDALDMVLHTLERMADGGIHDHLGGGFHRYSTDPRWHVPHFEKMLYDNAQLASLYMDAYAMTGDSRYVETARDTIGYVLRDILDPEGGFYSAEDADSVRSSLVDKSDSELSEAEKREGAFYVWESNEIAEILGEDAELFMYRYGVKPHGNVLHDPHNNFYDLNILYHARSVSETARRFERSERDVREVIAASAGKLFESRKHRPRPFRDDKVIAAWNGLMISALARGYQVLGDAVYLHAARDAACFITDRLMESPGILYRRWRDGARGIQGRAEDYTFVARSFLDLFECDGDAEWLKKAVGLVDSALDIFLDRDTGAVYSSPAGEHNHLLIRMEERFDVVEPSAASVLVDSLLRLHALNISPEYGKAAERILTRFGVDMRDNPLQTAFMLAMLKRFISPPQLIIIAGTPENQETRALIRAAQTKYMPNALQILLTPQNRDSLTARLPVLERYMEVDGHPAAYVCVNYTCQLPVTDPTALTSLLDRESALAI